MMKTRFWFCAAAVLTMFGSLMLGSGALAQTYKWDLPESYSPTTISGMAVGDFAKMVNERSGGRIAIKVHYNGSLGISEKDLLNSVEQGVITLSSTMLDKTLGVLPIAGVQSMPFMTGNLNDVRAMTKALRPQLDIELAKINQIYLFEAFATPVGIWAKKPVDSIEALKSIKLRTNNPNSTKTFQSAGATPTFLAWSDVMPAMTTGLIDAVLTSDESGISSRFYDQLKHFTRLNLEIGIWMIHMNKGTFDKLPPDLKKIVLDSANEAGKKAFDRVVGRLQENAKTLKANGVTITEVVPPAFHQHLLNSGAFLLEDWKKRVGPEVAGKILTGFEQAKKNN